MAKNLKLNIKNSQLAAVLKQNRDKKEKPPASTKKVVKNETPEIEDEESNAVVQKKRKAKKMPSSVISPKRPSAKPEIVEESVVEDAPSDDIESPIETSNIATEEFSKEVNHPVKAGPIDQPMPVLKRKAPEEEKPVSPKEEPVPIAKEKEVGAPKAPSGPPRRSENQRVKIIRGPREPLKPPTKASKDDGKDKSTRRPTQTANSNQTKVPPKDSDRKVNKPEKKKNFATPDKKPVKKAMPSYRRQAFSRVFDSRGRREDDNWRRRRNHKQRSRKSAEPVIRPSEVTVRLPISVKDLASEMKLKGTDVIHKLFLQGLPVTINDYLEDPTTVEVIGSEFSCVINIDTTQEDRLQITEKSIGEEICETEPGLLQSRPPIVTVMGHVDHGKTSIIDSFRKSNLASAEAGSITQHIGAFSCTTKHGDFTVLDTPGHAAFSAIRARGAQVTDIVVLVVAGDEGIKPQTEEAIDKARDAKVPIIVAINKSDKPGFNADEIYRQLADRNLLTEAWGGEIISVNCSAVTGEGVDTLAEMIALQSEVLELKANPTNRARGTVLESELNRGLGSSATLLIQNGTLKLGHAVIFEHEWGRVKTMQDEHGSPITEAGPSVAVKVTGLSGVPPTGNEFIALESEKEARKIAQERMTTSKHHQLQKSRAKDVEHLMQREIDNQQKKTLSIILKGDVGGSVEAVKEMILKIPTEKVDINFISTNVGQISESDIDLADASGALIVGFNTNLESHAEILVKKKKVKILLHDVIYHLVDEVTEHMLGLLDKVRKENEIGSAKVLATFKSSQLGIIAGCQISDGIIKRSSFIRIFRDEKELWSGNISSLKRHQDDVREVKKDLECGLVFDGFRDAKENDIIKAYEITYIKQEL